MNQTGAGSGRETRSDGATTRRRILEVAGERFAAAGFAETSNKEIAAVAGVDLASINYHFGTRAGLYQAVLAEAHRRLADRDDLERIVGGTGTAHDRLRALIRFLLGGGQSQWPMIVLGRELLSPSSHFQTLQEDEILPKIRIALPLLSELSGIPRDDPQLLPSLICVMIPCVAISLVARGSTPLAIRLQEATMDEISDQLFRFATGGLEALGSRHETDGNGAG
ncbi:MAG: TetR/AcrR family transcriptional regulator [Geminicoccaceae bacterium]|nr:TetR/AcrR family transcriptional regulator [Geminicoccaceae bacterium]